LSSSSLTIRQSTPWIVFTSDGYALSIQKFIVSIATNRASVHCSRTSRWRSGRMLARNTVSADREASESFGRNRSNTFRSVRSVWRRFGSRS
jgi:hypothetical protein